MLAIRQFLLELGHRIDRWVDFPAQPVLGTRDGRHNVTERDVAYDHQIDVAAAALLETGGGPVDKRDGNAWQQRCQ